VSSRGDALGYPFTPVPERATLALRNGQIAPMDFCIIAVLYERADVRRLANGDGTPSITLKQLAEAVGWTESPDALSKRLRRLRDRPEKWFTYTVQNRRRYVFALAPNVSEMCPSSESASCPSSDAAEAQAQSGLAATDDDDVSEVEEVLSAEGCPRTPSECPSSEGAEARTPPGIAVDGSGVRVRPAQTFRERPHLSNGAVEGEKSVVAHDTFGLVPEVREAIERARRARLVDAEAAA
jgi:hypothetical protein